MRNAILVDTEWCTGCHACEVACKVEHGLPADQYGIKFVQDGPRQLADGSWEFSFIPYITSLCDLCEDRCASGRIPTCVQHCQASCLTFGPVDELLAQMEGISERKTILFAREK